MSTEITSFIRERLTEDRLAHRFSHEWYEAVLEILDVHDVTWPILVQHPPEPQVVETVDDFNTVAYQLRQNIEWHTRDSYVKRFGQDPPTNPIVLSLARVWSTHQHFKDEWA